MTQDTNYQLDREEFAHTDPKKTGDIDLELIQAAVCFLIFKYTAKENITLPYTKDQKLFQKRWEIDEKSTLENLKEAKEDTPLTNHRQSLSDELSLWNPLFIETTNNDELKEALHLSEKHGIKPDIIFQTTPGLDRTITVHSSIASHTADQLTQIQNHWIHSIQLINTQEQSRVQKLTILTAEEYERIIYTWNATEQPREEGKFSFDDFDQHAQETPGKIAIISGSDSLTYRQLQHQANQLAHYLQKLGVGPEVVVGIYLTRSIDFVVALVALKKSGGAFLPLDPDHPADRKSYLIQDSRVPFIITSRQRQNSIPSGKYVTIVLEDIAEELKTLSTRCPSHGLKEGNMSYLFYTSGSTGQPKGVMMKVYYDLKKNNWSENDPPKDTEKVLLKSSTGFTLILLETFSPLQKGGQIVVVPKDKDTDPEWLINSIKKEQVENLNLVPSALANLLLQKEITSCTSIKNVFTVGERLPVAVQRDFFKKLPLAKLFVYYGCTEAPAATFRELKPDEDYGNRVVLGKPMTNKKLYLLDKFGVPVPIGVSGEIFIGGSISRGYYHNEALTEERFLEDPFSKQEGARMYQSGDLGRYLSDGSLEYIGRTDFQVQIRGIRIEPGEIEACISSHPMVSAAVVLAHKNTGGVTTLIAYFTTNAGTYQDDEQLQKFVRDKLPQYMIPTRFIQLESFPLNTSGKIDRINFPDPESVRKTKNGNFVSEGYSITESYLRSVFYETLGTLQFYKHENFFEIGGDSLLAITAINKIEKILKVKISLPDFYENSSIQALANIINAKGYKSKFDLLVQIRTGAGRKNLFLFSSGESANSHIDQVFDLYILRGLWYNEKFDFSEPLSSIIDKYVKEILMVQSEGIFYLAGFSMGGTLAHQVACKLQSLGYEVATLHLVDPSPPNYENSLIGANNLTALWYRIRTYRVRSGLGMPFSYLLNFLGFKPLVRHRARIALHYYKVLVTACEFDTFSGDAHLYHSTIFGTKSIDKWKKLLTGNISTQELSTSDHNAMDLHPFQKIWCEQIKP